MGDVAFSTLRSQGGLLAGDDELDAAITAKVKRWLRQQAAGWTWPVLRQRYSNIALAAGATRLQIGGGVGAAVDETGANVTVGELIRIFDPMWCYDATYGTKQRVNITKDTSVNAYADESINDPTRSTGTPVVAKVKPLLSSTVLGQMLIFPRPVPDKAYLLALDAQVMPADPGESDFLWYPNDETVIKAVEAFVYNYNDGASSPDYITAQKQLTEMVAEDRRKYGVIPGANDHMGLDSAVFLDSNDGGWGSRGPFR